MKVTRATRVTPELATLFEHALRDVTSKRGGAALLVTLCGQLPENELLEHLVTTSALWSAVEDGELKGFVVCRGRLVEAIYVAYPYRRQKVATKLVAALLASSEPPVDAYALPGDRGLKSLYESLGWKARLLTMRGA